MLLYLTASFFFMVDSTSRMRSSQRANKEGTIRNEDGTVWRIFAYEMRHDDIAYRRDFSETQPSACL